MLSRPANSFKKRLDRPQLSTSQSYDAETNQTSPIRISPPTSAASEIVPRKKGRCSLRDTFSCHLPINPHMRSKEARLQTFLDNSSIWPAHRIRATPHQIVDAGMYYLGERDRVKCWYCNGGLQNWEKDDSPWEEHAKWFPLCEYVLQQKGPDYVHGIVSKFPGLRRPTLSNPASFASTSTSNSQSVPNVIDPKQELEEASRRAAEDMEVSPLVADARLMGFADSRIQNALKR